MKTTFVLKQAVDELKETNNFNLWKAPPVALSVNKGRFQKRCLLFFNFFLFFDDESVLKPMQWQKDGKFLI